MFDCCRSLLQCLPCVNGSRDEIPSSEPGDTVKLNNTRMVVTGSQLNLPSTEGRHYCHDYVSNQLFENCKIVNSPKTALPAQDVNHSGAITDEGCTGLDKVKYQLSKLIMVFSDVNNLEQLAEKYKREPLSSVFSPSLTADSWNQQLRILQNNGASICGLDLSGFSSVNVVDLSEIPPTDTGFLTKEAPKELIVIHGQCCRDGKHLPIARGVTVIGSAAPVTVGNETFKLDIPEAKITANPERSKVVDNNWLIAKKADCSNPDDINTNAMDLNARFFPLVYLNESNLIGVTLNCAGVTQGIAGSNDPAGNQEGTIYVRHNVIKNSLPWGVILHDCEADVKDNQFKGGVCSDELAKNSTINQNSNRRVFIQTPPRRDLRIRSCRIL